MIRRRIPLTPSASRCPETRQVPCSRAHECARGVEPHSKGRGVHDFSAEPRIYGGPCGYFLAITYADDVKPAPKVHDAPGWLK